MLYLRDLAQAGHRRVGNVIREHASKTLIAKSFPFGNRAKAAHAATCDFGIRSNGAAFAVEVGDVCDGVHGGVLSVNSECYINHPSARVNICAHIIVHVLTFVLAWLSCQIMLMARHRKPVNVTLPPDLIERLQAWMDQQAAPWNRAAAIELALKEWLDRQERADEKD